MTFGNVSLCAAALALAADFAACSDQSGCPTDGDGDDEDTSSDTGGESLDCAGGRYQPSADLCWQQPRAYGTFDWQDAIDYCEDLELEGHSDWFLPAIQDIVGLLEGCDNDVLAGESGYCTPCYQSESCGDVLRPYTGGKFWSSSLGEVFPWGENAWFVDFNAGRVLGDDIDHEYYARCVRSGP
jgi:hypothetical protein